MVAYHQMQINDKFKHLLQFRHFFQNEKTEMSKTKLYTAVRRNKQSPLTNSQSQNNKKQNF